MHGKPRLVHHLEAYSGVKLPKPEPQSQVLTRPAFLYLSSAQCAFKALKAIEATAQLRHDTPNPCPLMK